MTDLSKKQSEIYLELYDFITKSSSSLKIFTGRAGSGKTTIIAELVNKTPASLAVITLSGKAAGVLRSKGVECAQTIHSFLYDPILDDSGELLGFKRKDRSEFFEDVIIIDEGSMVSSELLEDLSSLNIKLLIIGDKNQLPSIGDDDFDIMANYDIELDEIHRHQKDSPILQLSQEILECGGMPSNIIESEEIKLINHDNLRGHVMKFGNEYDVALCGTNYNRTILNKLFRNHYGYRSRIPQVSEKIVCLKNNNTDGCDHYNGDVFVVRGVVSMKNDDVNGYLCEKSDKLNKYSRNILIHDDVWLNGFTSKNFITHENKRIAVEKFDFAYALTVHKSQGSEYETVLFRNEDVGSWLDPSRFAYTAVTRAKSRITIVI